MLIHLETSPLSVENFLFFFSFFFFLLLGGFKVLAKRAFQKAAMRSIVKAKKEYNDPRHDCPRCSSNSREKRKRAEMKEDTKV